MRTLEQLSWFDVARAEAAGRMLQMTVVMFVLSKRWFGFLLLCMTSMPLDPKKLETSDPTQFEEVPFLNAE